MSSQNLYVKILILKGDNIVGGPFGKYVRHEGRTLRNEID